MHAGDTGVTVWDAGEPRTMSTAAASEANGDDTGGVCCNGGGGYGAGAGPGSHSDNAANQGRPREKATSLQHDMSVDANGTADMPVANSANEQGSAMREDAGGGQQTTHRTCTEHATANGSTMMASEAAASADVSMNTDSRVQEDSGVSKSSGAALDGIVVGRMMSTEGQRSTENLSGAKSGVTEGSMGTVSVADAGSVTLTNGREALDPTAFPSTAAGGDDSEAQLALRDEDLRDAAEVDEYCEAFVFPGVPPLDDFSLTDDESQLILGAQVERSICSG